MGGVKDENHTPPCGHLLPRIFYLHAPWFGQRCDGRREEEGGAQSGPPPFILPGQPQGPSSRDRSKAGTRDRSIIGRPIPAKEGG